MTSTPASTSFAVPSIDIAAYVEDGTPHERAVVASAVDRACSEVGFIQIHGHGIEPGTIAGLASALDDFFALGLDAKKEYVLTGVNRGYTPPKSETLSLSLGVDSQTRMHDFFEAYNLGSEAAWFDGLDLSEIDYAPNLWPRIDGFEARVSAYYDEAARVARTLLRIFADALGVDHEALAGVTDHSIDVLRMNNYALPEGSDAQGRDLTGMSEHTDFGLVTVLWADQVAGLQVLGTDGLWHDVQPEDGALLVNLGDLTARLTNDRWMSTLHRVKPPVIDGTTRRRRSAAFFHDGNIEATIATLPKFVGVDGDAYEPVTVGDHIAAKLAGSRQGTKNGKAQREAARVLAAQSRS